ncbi:transcription factor IIA alpha-beta subunit [Trypanosoma theileri]|uniref:Transcription factor IIA alpha-beta subunit n=1 Tax=Trypanosoma theileri TaxID=67003 RepID=A0A1X0P687_9TRYP|nr:transcription factor IIA alpha-beta subunit [Trypanosoma theileri]ORC92442.1 transcription factor IIA alpha-beta subunit [Trypanosoma theileri]
MPKKLTQSSGRGIYNLNEDVCPTSDAYLRALEYFRVILLERVTHHEDEVFSARARFQMQRDQDREHFERTQRRRQRAEHGGRSRPTVLQQLEQAAAGEMVSETMSSAEEEFRADQQKLYIEHEEELQELYPLAFLSEESAGVVAFTLLPMLRGKLMALGQQRTEGWKEQMKVLEENGSLQSTNNNNNNNHSVLSTCNSQARTGGVEKIQRTSVKSEHEQVGGTTVPEIGRGAYIIPLSHSSHPVSQSCRTGVVNNNNIARREETLNTEEVVEEEEDEEEERHHHHHHQGKAGDNNSLVQAPWLTNLSTLGAVEFVRIAFLCNERYRQERYSEKRRCFESCLNTCNMRAKQRVVQKLLRRAKEDEVHDVKKMAELWRQLHEVQERVIGGNSDDNVLDDTKVKTVSSENNEKTGEKWFSPSYLRRVMRKVRMELISGNENGNNGGNGKNLIAPVIATNTSTTTTTRAAITTITAITNTNNTTTITNTNNTSTSTTTTTTTTTTNNNNNTNTSCSTYFSGGQEYPSSFDTTHWVTITLDDNKNKNTSDDIDLEAVADTYMWPKHIEASISNVLCGEVVRSGKRLLLFNSDMIRKEYIEKIEEEHECDGNGIAEDYVRTQQKHDDVKKMFHASLPVVALPQQGKKVWLKVNTLGDFIAGEVKFYQSHSPF